VGKLTLNNIRAQVIIQTLSKIQDRFNTIYNDKAQIHKLAEEGAAKANAIAEKRMTEIKKIVGLYC